MRVAAAVGLLAAFGAALLVGCGTHFPLPTEQLAEYSTEDSYLVAATWTFPDSVADILLTQGTGSQLYLLFNHGGMGTAPRGRVRAYALKAPPPSPAPLPGYEFPHLFVPAALCATRDQVFVLDQGDTCLARLNPLTSRCDTVGDTTWTNRITDLSLYWRVREYGLRGLDTLSTFTDTSMAFVRGVAADAQGRVYVSGSAIVLIPDQQDPRILTRLFQFRVNRYRKVVPGSEPPDPYMPGTNEWVRDREFIVEEGSGDGTLSDPRGLYWGAPGAPDGPGLFAADFGKNWVQKLSDAMSSTGLIRIDADTASNLSGPADVTADLSGFIYVADTGNRRVLRYAPDGTFTHRVDVRLDTYGLPLQDPTAVAADDTLVYVSDGAARKVVRYRRQ